MRGGGAIVRLGPVCTYKGEPVPRGSKIWIRLIRRWSVEPRSEWPACAAQTRAGTPCKARPMRDPSRPRRPVPSMRCRLHGGASTGPRTSEGRQRIAEAQRRRWEAWSALTGQPLNRRRLGARS
jgi:hypothetical protein